MPLILRIDFEYSTEPELTAGTETSPTQHVSQVVGVAHVPLIVHRTLPTRHQPLKSCAIVKNCLRGKGDTEKEVSSKQKKILLHKHSLCCQGWRIITVQSIHKI